MRRFFFSAFVFLLVAPLVAQAAKPINATCPVKGEPAKPNLTTTYKGQVIGFC